MSHTDKRHTKPAVPNQKSKWRDTVPLSRPTENAVIRVEESRDDEDDREYNDWVTRKLLERDDLSPEIRERLESSLREDTDNATSP